VAAELYRQPTLRANLAAMGETLAQREGVADAGTAATAKELLSQLAQVPGLPIGWASFWPSEPTLTPSPGSMPGESVTGSLFAAEARTLQKWLGLLLSVVATSLGAPFWFQLLNRIVSLRGNGKAAVAAVVDQDRDAAAGKDAVLPVATRSASAGEPVPTAVATRRTAKIDDAYWEHARHTPRRPLATGSQLAGIAGSDLGLALDVARLAKLVYRDLADASTIATSLGWQEVRAFSEAGTQAMALSRDDLVVVVYRGTEPSALDDLITDAKFRLRPATELVAAARGRVHRGFLQALQHVLPQLEALLAQPPFAGKPVVCTGHSLGGALATLHARVRLASTPANLRAAQPLVTFGSPRVGDAAFCAELQGLLGHGGGLRFVHGRDLVTRVPTRVQDYDHVGRVCYFDDAGRLQPDGAEWFRWLADVIDATQDFRAASKRTVADHDCDHYVMALEAILPLVR
jgi:triacylglycerol lipase